MLPRRPASELLDRSSPPRFHCRPACLTDLLHHFVKQFLSAGSQHDVGALLSEEFGNRPTNALASAGDNCSLTFKKLVHDLLLASNARRELLWRWCRKRVKNGTMLTSVSGLWQLCILPLVTAEAEVNPRL